MTSEGRRKPTLDADESAALQSIGWRPAAEGSSCPDSSLLLPAEEGTLDDAAMGTRIRAHVESCATCRRLAADLALVLAEEPSTQEAGRIAARIQAGRPPTRRSARWLGVAGLLTAAAIAAYAFVPWRAVRTDPPQLPGNSEPAISPPVPTVFLGSRPVIARPEPELTVRGDAPPVPLAEQLGQALDVADGGDLGRAAATLEVLVKKNPVSADAHLALGATLLRAERPDEALPLLERARSLTKTSSTDEVDWFLAVALARAHNTARASSILEPLCAKTTPRASTACLGLAELKKNPK